MAAMSRLPLAGSPLPVWQPPLELVATQTGLPLLLTHFRPDAQGFGLHGLVDTVGMRGGVRGGVGVPQETHMPMPSAQC